MAGQTFYKDKPYVFVPFVDKVERKEVVSHQEILKGNYCGSLKITLEAIMPLHFGQGELIGKKGILVHALTKEQGQVAYPGSSFKGMLRAVFEAVTPSCILLSPERGKGGQEKQMRFDNASLARCKDSRESKGSMNLCPSCSVFGMTEGNRGYKGKLHFTSFLAAEKVKCQELVIPELKSPFSDYPKGEIGNERLYYGSFQDIRGTDIANMDKEEFFAKKKREQKERVNAEKLHQFYGRKFYKHGSICVKGNDETGCTYECLMKGSELTGYINYEGLTQEELGMLAFSLGLGWETPVYYKIGYAKPAYFGSVSLKVEAVELPVRYRRLRASVTSKQFCADLGQLTELAHDYYLNSGSSVKKAVKAIQEVWSSAEGEFQWKEGQSGGLSY